MYYINKLVGWVLSPIGILFLGLALGYVLRFFAKERNWLRHTGTVVIGLTLAVVWIFGCDATSRVIGVPLETNYVQEGVIHGDITAIPAAELIVVLGGGMGEHYECHAPEILAGADRVWQGARLYKAGKAPKLILTGGGSIYGARPLLLDFGVPAEAIACHAEARNTEEEARIIAANGIQKIILVTSAWHMDRSRLLFERAGLEVIPAPTDFEFHFVLEQPLRLHDFIPNVNGFQRNAYALKEWVALVGYKLLRR